MEVVLGFEPRVGGWRDGWAFLWRKHTGAASERMFWGHTERWICIKKTLTFDSC